MKNNVAIAIVLIALLTYVGNIAFPTEVAGVLTLTGLWTAVNGDDSTFKRTLASCKALKYMVFDQTASYPVEVMQSARHHWQRLDCSNTLAKASTLHDRATGTTSVQRTSTSITNEQKVSHDAKTELEGPDPVSKEEKAIRREQERHVVFCHQIRKATNLIPHKSWGTATKEQQSQWQNGQCEKYGGITPGTIDSDAIRVITESEADVIQVSDKQKSIHGNSRVRVTLEEPKLNDGKTDSAVGDGGESTIGGGDRKEDAVWCYANVKKYNIIPGKSWGTLPINMRDVWKEHACDVIFTLNRRKAYKMVDCPVDQKGNTTLPLIAVMAASTTRKVVRPSPRTMSLFTYLLPSLRTSVDCGFRYLFVMGYDVGDPYHDSENGMSTTRAWIDQHIIKVLGSRNIELSFMPVPVKNTIKKPGPVFIGMARAAYEAGADFMYRLNDDTELVGRWPQRFVNALKSLPPPYGVVGPFCDGNKKILTHDFVHRTHMEIFEMNYYPPALVDWWMDDWVTLVYGFGRTLMVREAEVIHHTGAHGQRYKVDRANERKVSQLVVDGRTQIKKWMLKHETPDRDIEEFDKETKPKYILGRIKMKEWHDPGDKHLHAKPGAVPGGEGGAKPRPGHGPWKRKALPPGLVPLEPERHAGRVHKPWSARKQSPGPRQDRG